MGYIPPTPSRYISLAPMGSRETNPFGQRASLKPLLCTQCGAPLQNERECEYCGVRFVETGKAHNYNCDYSINVRTSPGVPARDFEKTASTKWLEQFGRDIESEKEQFGLLLLPAFQKLTQGLIELCA